MPTADTGVAPAFMWVSDACRYFGISRSRLCGHLVKLDDGILVQVGARTIVDMARLAALISAMPRGPRRPGSKVVPRSPGRPRKSGGHRGWPWCSTTAKR